MSQPLLEKLSFHSVIQTWFEDSFESISPPRSRDGPQFVKAIIP